MTDFTKEWGDVFNKAETIFHRDITATKKTNKPVGELLAEELEPIRKPVALLTALIAIDKISLNAGNAKEIAALPDNIKLYKVALAKLQGEATKLEKTLVAAQKLQPSMKDKNGLVVPTPIKTFLPDSYRQFKLVQTEMNAIVARAENALKGALNQAEATKINEAKEKAKAKTEDEAERKAITEEANMKQLVLALSSSFKSSMAKGAAVIQRIKASPDVATYNKEMNNGGRDISQNLVNIGKLQANSKMKDSPLAKKLPAPGRLATDITPFANGNKRNLDPAATPQDVKAHLVEFTKLYKDIATTYADLLTGKLG
jgi:hypothetical protein